MACWQAGATLDLATRGRNATTKMGSPRTQQNRVTTDRRSGSSSPAAQQRCSAAAAIRLQMAIRPSADWETGRRALTPAVTVAALAIFQTGAEMARTHLHPDARMQLWWPKYRVI